MPEIPDITPATLAPFLKTHSFARRLVSCLCLESTNVFAAELAADPATPEGLIVVADHQTGGRGRNGRLWFSPPNRNLYFSLLLRPTCAPGLVPQLAIVAALSLHKAIAGLDATLPVSVKWPNDIWCDGRKLSGILCSMSCIGMKTDYAIVGIGVNVNLAAAEIPTELADTATSLWILSGHQWCRARLLADFANAFEEDCLLWSEAHSLKPFMERWRAVSILDGRLITAERGTATVTGIADGITEDGRLILLSDEHRQIFIAAGDAHILSSQQPPRHSND